MNIDWKIDDTLRYATARIIGQSGWIWAQVEQRGNVIGFSSCGDVGQEVVEAAVEILRRYTVTGRIWVLEPEPEPSPDQFVDLPCRHCGETVRFTCTPDSIEILAQVRSRLGLPS